MRLLFRSCIFMRRRYLCSIAIFFSISPFKNIAVSGYHVLFTLNVERMPGHVRMTRKTYSFDNVHLWFTRYVRQTLHTIMEFEKF